MSGDPTNSGLRRHSVSAKFEQSHSSGHVAPTTFQPVIRNERETGARELVLMRWGLVSFFTKQLSDVKRISTINARAETVEKSGTYKSPFQKRRCLVSVGAFYEWKKLDVKSK